VIEVVQEQVEGGEALDQAGITSGLLPDWERVRSRPQRNAVHRFTLAHKPTDRAPLPMAVIGVTPTSTNLENIRTDCKLLFFV
jgi:hypothetical protein